MEDIDASTSTSSSSTVPTTRPTLTRDSSSTTGSNRPRGILKNTIPTATESGQQNEGVRWDEVNLNYNEVQKEATTRMQITEPKTPYVRYNAETDEVMDLDKIPGFELGQMDGNDQQSQAASSSSLAGQQYDGDDTDMQEGSTSATGSAGINSSDNEMQYQQQQPVTTTTSSSSASGSGSGSAGGRPGAMRAPSASSRSSSFSGSRRGSESTSRRGSDVSERKMVVVEDHGPGVDAEDEGADEETRQAKKEFKLRRGSHYSGEGEMMKRFRAGILDLDDEDEEGGGGGGGAEDTNEDESAIDIDDAPTQNGSAHVNGQGNTSSRSGRRIPPVPPLPNGSA